MSYYKSILQIIISFIIITLAQPDWSVAASVAAACFGYALFWFGIKDFSNSKKFLAACSWMFFIQVIQMSWLLSDKYVGPAIFAVVALLCVIFALQWAGLCLFVNRSPWLVAGIWATMEWSRIFLFAGYAFNPVGLSLTSSTYSMQIIGIAGIYGLSFLVIATNLLFYQKRTKLALSCALIPYLLGGVFFHFHQAGITRADKMGVVLLQPVVDPMHPDARLWEKLCCYLEPYYGDKVDLIVFPESILPFLAYEDVYPRQWVDELFSRSFGGSSSGYEKVKLSNADIASALSKVFDAKVVVGMEDPNYNTAICFDGDKKNHYHKQVLLPFGEYIPKIFKPFEKYFVGCGKYVHGNETKVFSEGLGISICYEEMFGHLMRKNRLMGAHMMINISNDVWYPNSRLPLVHYMHGRLRTIEMGLPMVRSCNTGVTCGIDATGKMLDCLPYETRKAGAPASALKISLPLYGYKTLYTYVGDYLILGLVPLLGLRKMRAIR